MILTKILVFAIIFIIVAIIAIKIALKILAKNEEIEMLNEYNGELYRIGKKRIENAKIHNGLMELEGNIQYVTTTLQVYTSKYPFFALMKDNKKKLINKDSETGKLLIEKFKKEY